MDEPRAKEGAPNLLEGSMSHEKETSRRNTQSSQTQRTPADIEGRIRLTPFRRLAKPFDWEKFDRHGVQWTK